MRLFTIGFTKKSAEIFFTILCNAGVRRVIDIRLNNASQLAGFAKKDDVKYFLKTICNIEYIHMPELAPTEDILEAFKKNKGDWAIYERDFIDLITKRKIEAKLSRELFNDACLLCSEEKPLQCHRRLVAEYLKDKWNDVEIKHII